MKNFWGKNRFGQNCKFGEFVDIGGVEFGDNCKIQAFCAIPPGWHFGNNVFIGQGVVFINDKHPKAIGDWQCVGGYVEDDVSIGSNCTIFPVRIGKGAIIGAGSVLTKDVPPGETWFGNPAKNMKQEELKI